MATKRTFLIDGDVLLYRYGFANQESIQWEEGVSSEWENPSLAIAEMQQFIRNLRKKTDCKNVLVCLSGPSSQIFRYQLLSSYKHTRQDKEKPKLFSILKDNLFENYKVVQKSNLEADDSMGILATKKPGKYVIASVDKDLAQIPGYLYNWDKNDEPQKISKVEADKYFYKQCLSGDPVDGFSGVPGIGKVWSDKIIEGLYEEEEPDKEQVWTRILAEYQKKGLDEKYALTMARMARILRYEDWDGEKQEPILWSPYK